MATPKKKHLIELMIEAGVEWPEGAKYAAQDKDRLCVRFYEKGKPFHNFGVNYWDSLGGSLIRDLMTKLPSLCCNWHQTIVTKEQYKQALTTRCTVEPANTQAETKPTVTSLTLEELLSNYQRYQQLATEALQALQNKGKQLGLVITVDESK